MENLKKKYPKLFNKKILIPALLFGIFLIALLLRIIYLPQKAVSFAYDQARDAFIVQEILNGDFKILGPSVSGVPGLYHGVLFYYVLTLGYMLGGGNPLGAAYLLSFLNSLTVFVAFFLSFVITKKNTPSLISAILFAFSFEASQYSNLLTNVSLAIWFVPLMYIGLFLWITKTTKWAPAISGLALGFSIQSEIALGYHIIPVLFWLVIFREKITRSDILQFFISFLLTTATMILVEFKFGFKGIAGIFYLFSGQDKIASAKELGDFTVIYLNQIGTTFARNIFPINLVFGGLLGLSAIIYSFSNKGKIGLKKLLSWQIFLLSYVLAHIVALPFGGGNMKHITVGSTVGICVFLGIFLWRYFTNAKIRYVVLIIILLLNFIKIIVENVNGQTIFPLQKDLVLSKELDLIDYTYQSSGNMKFSINSLTSPLFVNTLWSYLYNWYGQNKYGYIPYWTGKDQIGQLGNNLDYPTDEVKLHYYIIEPTYGIPSEYVTYGIGEENSNSKIIEEKTFGELVVQKRINL